MSFPEMLEVLPLNQPPVATVRVPGSKSITNRALVLAALFSKGQDCELQGALRSEDTEVMIDSLRALGFDVRTDWDRPEPIVSVGSEEEQNLIPARRADLFVANSGTSMRFLTALVSLGQGRYRLDGVPRMRERPIEDLLVALRQLGVPAWSEYDNGCPPVIVEANGLTGGHVRMRGAISSQFLSGLLMVAAFAREAVVIDLEGPLVSWPYVSMTVEMMRRWAIPVQVESARRFQVGRPTCSGIGSFAIEPDASAASYFFAAAAITQGQVTVPNLSMHSLQGDVRFVELLEDMGCSITRGVDGLTVQCGPLHGIDVEMNDISDTVMTLGAVACFAEGPTTIRQVSHIRHKETDRLSALATELRRVGARVDEFADGLKITPGPLHGATIETYNDHRMAMSLALIGLRVPGIALRDPGCVAKTYPEFFDDLERLRR